MSFDVPKLRVFRHGDRWWLRVPEALLIGGERGVYSRRTFAAILKELDFYLERGRAPRLVRRKTWLTP